LRRGFGFEPIAQTIQLAQSNWEVSSLPELKPSEDLLLLIGHCFERLTEK